METFSALLALCAGNSPVTGEFPTQRPVTRGFDVFFDLCLNKKLNKQSWSWWFETLSSSLWRHCNEYLIIKGLSHKIIMHTKYLLPFSRLNLVITNRYFKYPKLGCPGSFSVTLAGADPTHLQVQHLLLIHIFNCTSWYSYCWAVWKIMVDQSAIWIHCFRSTQLLLWTSSSSTKDGLYRSSNSF